MDCHILKERRFDNMAKLGAGIRKRSDGKYEKRFTISGKRYSIYGSSTKEIEEKEADIREKIRQGIYNNNASVTLDRYFEEWKKGKRATTKSNSLRAYTSIYNKHISAELGKKKVQSIERREIIALQNKLAEELQANSVNYVMTVLKMIFRSAVDDDIILKSPCKGIKPLKAEQEAKDNIHRALTVEEQTDFMQYMKDRYLYECIAFMLLTGVRVGEASAITWRDIDYKNNVIHINKTITRTENEEKAVGTPKSEASKRDIPLTEDTKKILKSQKAKCELLKGSNIIGLDERIFPTINGKILMSDSIGYEIKAVLKIMEKDGKHIDTFTAHAFRDTFATRFIEQGGTPQTLKTILGHTHLSMTMDLYSHVLPNTKAEEMQKISIII